MLYNGLIIDNTYQVINEIGSGGMGVVYLALHVRLEKYVVLKRLKNTVEDIHWLRNEVDILKSLHHPYLPQVYDFIQYEGDLFTVIDYISGYDLKYYLDNGYTFTENQLTKWLRQLAEVLCYLHSHVPPIYHMDIKPANIIITGNMDICLIDFGISLTGKYQLYGISAYYSAPEQYANAVYIQSGQSHLCVELDGRADIYGIGATFYHLMTRVCPNLLDPKPPITSYSLPYSDALIHIVDKAMAMDRNNRYKDANAFYKAIVGIHKSDLSYRLNFAARIAASALAGIIIVAGALLVIDDVRSDRRSVYEKDYNLFVESFKKGDNDSTIQLGRKMLNDTAYRDYTDDRTRSEIFHAIGDCYYNEQDYVNAVDNYRLAYEAVADTEKTEALYRDYAVALIRSGNTELARSVLDDLNARYPESTAVYLIRSQLSMNDPSLALQYAQTALDKAYDDETRLSALERLGDINRETGDLSGAADRYAQALGIKETDVILRKQGLVLLAQSSENKNYAAEAKDCFMRLYNSYYYTENDVFNLSQCCLIIGDNGSVKEALDITLRYMESYGESCRMDIIAALLYESRGDSLAGEYAVKAHDVFQQLSAEDKSAIDRDSLNEISRIYRSRTGGIW